MLSNTTLVKFRMHVLEVALNVLHEPVGDEKVRLTLEAFDLHAKGDLEYPQSASSRSEPVPDYPARDASLKFVHPSQAPRRGKGGTLESRKAILHALTHIECTAVDLAWDIIARFGQHEEYADVLPKEFYEDFLVVAADEARHYTALRARLEDLGGRYGDLDVHEGLWDSARRTKDRLEARLAVEHALHEARGLDVLPGTIERFKRGGDAETARLLEEVILPEEVGHCAAGVKWIKWLKQESGREKYAGRVWAEDAKTFDSVEDWFHSLVRGYFDGFLKPPFNTAAREAAGFTPAWYLPLAEV